MIVLVLNVLIVVVFNLEIDNDSILSIEMFFFRRNFEMYWKSIEIYVSYK